MVILIVSSALIITGILSWLFTFNPFISFAIGLVLGIALIICLLKKMAQWAVKSLIAWTIIASIFSYKVANNFVKQQNQERQRRDNPVSNQDYKDMLAVLKAQGFTPALAKEAVEYVLAQIPDDTLEEKIRMAFKYLGNGHKELSIIRR